MHKNTQYSILANMKTIEDLAEHNIEMELSKGDKYNSESQCAYELSDEVLERIENSDHNLKSLKLRASNTQQELLSLLRTDKEMCEKAGNLIGNNTHLDELYVNIHMRSDDEENYDYDDIAENYDEFLKGVANNRSLTVLDLGYIPDRSEAIPLLAPLFGKKGALKSFSFENCNFVQTVLLTTFLSRTIDDRGTLKHLSLVGTWGEGSMNDHAGNLIKTLNKSHNIETLTLNWTTINADTSLALSNMLKNPSCTLKKLTLEDNEFDEEDVAVLAEGILENSTLEELNLKGSEHVTGDGWVNFFNILRPAKLGELHTLCLESNNINDEALDELSRVFANNDTLKKLSLSDNASITTAGWQKLGSIFLTNSAIDTIKITNGNGSFDDDAVIAWTIALSLSKNTILNELLLSPHGITSTGWSALENLVCNMTSIDSLYDSNHTLKIWGGDTKIEHFEGVPTTMISYQEFQYRYHLAMCTKRVMVKRLARSLGKESDSDNLQDIMKTHFNKLEKTETRHEKALQKIVHFYFMSGEANMKDIWDMELNVMVHAIATVGCFAKYNIVPSTSEHTLLYQIMRSVPSLFDVSSSNMKNRKVGSK